MITSLEDQTQQNKLSIVQWNALRKLCKRDKELSEVGANLKVLEKYFQIKNLLINKENFQIKEKIECIINGILPDGAGVS